MLATKGGTVKPGNSVQGTTNYGRKLKTDPQSKSSGKVFKTVKEEKNKTGCGSKCTPHSLGDKVLRTLKKKKKVSLSYKTKESYLI